MNLAEVAPAAPAIANLLEPLLVIVSFGVALGIAYLALKLTEWLFSALTAVTSWIPLVNRVTAAAIHAVEAKLTSVMNSFIKNMEGHIATAFHSLAREAHRFWVMHENLALNLYHLAERINRLVTTGDVVRWFHDLEHVFTRRVTQLTKEITRTVRVTKVKVESVAQGVYPRLRTLEHEVEKTLPREIKHARTLAREAENGVARLWEWTRSLADNPAITAAVATAVAALGFGELQWLRCTGRNSLLGRAGCGLWNLLEDALGFLVSALVLENVCSFLPLLEDAFGAVVSPAVHLLNEVPLGGCETPPSGWAEIHSTVGPRPPAQTLGAFPG